MGNAHDYLEYLNEHPEERQLSRKLAPAELQEHIKELGFEFTPEELQEEMELGVELSEDALDAAGGESCDGHCGKTCESDSCDCHNEDCCGLGAAAGGC